MRSPALISCPQEHFELNRAVIQRGSPEYFGIGFVVVQFGLWVSLGFKQQGQWGFPVRNSKSKDLTTE
jgi:hypothetical protein